MDDLEQTLQDCHQLLLVIEQGSVWSRKTRSGAAYNERLSRTTLHQPQARETNGDCHYLQKPPYPSNLGESNKEVVDEEDQERQLPWLQQHLI